MSRTAIAKDNAWRNVLACASGSKRLHRLELVQRLGAPPRDVLENLIELPNPLIGEGEASAQTLLLLHRSIDSAQYLCDSVSAFSPLPFMTNPPTRIAGPMGDCIEGHGTERHPSAARGDRASAEPREGGVLGGCSAEPRYCTSCAGGSIGRDRDWNAGVRRRASDCGRYEVAGYSLRCDSSSSEAADLLSSNGDISEEFARSLRHRLIVTSHEVDHAMHDDPQRSSWRSPYAWSFAEVAAVASCVTATSVW